MAYRLSESAPLSKGLSLTARSVISTSSTNPPSLFGGPFSRELDRVQGQEQYQERNEEDKRDQEDEGHQEHEQEHDSEDDDERGEREHEHDQDSDTTTTPTNGLESIFGNQAKEQEDCHRPGTQSTVTVQGSEGAQGDLFVPLDQEGNDFLSSHKLNEDSEPPDSRPRYVLRPGLRDLLKNFVPISTVFDIDKTGTFDPKQQEEPHVIANRLPDRFRAPASLYPQNKSAHPIAGGSRPVMSTSLETARRQGHRKLVKIVLKSGQYSEKLRILRADESTINDSGARIRGQDNWPYDADGNVVNLSNLSTDNIVNGRLRVRDRERGAKDQNEVHLGMPAMRGCKGCWAKGVGDRCSLIRGGLYPCRCCIENKDQCHLFLEPDLKARCIDCREKKRTDCCFDTNPEKRGSCKNCQDKGWKCIAGPKNPPKSRLYTKKKLLSSRDLNIPENHLEESDTSIDSSLIEGTQNEGSSGQEADEESGPDIDQEKEQRNMAEKAEADEQAEDAEDEMDMETETEPEDKFQIQGERNLREQARINRALTSSIPNYREGHQSTAPAQETDVRRQDFDRARSSNTIMSDGSTHQADLNNKVHNNTSHRSFKKRKKDKKGKSRANHKRPRTAPQPPQPLKLAKPPKPLFNAPVLRIATISLHGSEWRHRPSPNTSLSITVRRYGPPAQRNSFSRAWRQRYITEPVQSVSQFPQDMRRTTCARLAPLPQQQPLSQPLSPAQSTQQTTYMMSGALPSTQGSISGPSQMQQRKTVKTLMHHPIQLNAPSGLCNWCKQTSFAWLGCGCPREIEVDVMPDGTWKEVARTTHPGDAMCRSCTFRILAALNCPGHEMADLSGGVPRLSQSQIFRRLRDSSTKMASLPPLCAVCMSPADKQCNVRPENGVVCGLALCKSCCPALDLNAGNIEQLIDNKRQENDNLKTMRADAFVFELVRKWHQQHRPDWLQSRARDQHGCPL